MKPSQATRYLLLSCSYLALYLCCHGLYHGHHDLHGPEKTLDERDRSFVSQDPVLGFDYEYDMGLTMNLGTSPYSQMPSDADVALNPTPAIASSELDYRGVELQDANVHTSLPFFMPEEKLHEVLIMALAAAPPAGASPDTE